MYTLRVYVYIRIRVNRRPYVGTIEVSSRPQTDRKSNSRANPVFDLVRHILYEAVRKKDEFPMDRLYAHAMNVIDSTTIIIMIIIKVIARLFIYSCLNIIYYVRKTA